MIVVKNPRETLNPSAEKNCPKSRDDAGGNSREERPRWAPPSRQQGVPSAATEQAPTAAAARPAQPKKKPARKEKTPKPCAWCDKEFTPKRDDQQLCEPGKDGKCYKERESARSMCKKAGLPPNEFSGDKTAVHQRLEEARAAKKLQSPADQPTGTASAILRPQPGL